MTNPLAEGCSHELASWSARLTQLGRLTRVQYRGCWQSPSEVMEEYEVLFAHGQLTWFIGLAADGRIHVLWPQG